MQWGSCNLGTDSASTISLPISFSSVLHAASFIQNDTSDQKEYTNGVRLHSYTTSSITVLNRAWSCKNLYFIICKQQWRYLEALSSKNIWTYPIAFLNFVIPITTRHYDHADEQSTQEMAVTEMSLTFCKILRGSSYTKGIFCYAIGVQQWGYNNTNTAATIKFPLTFSMACHSITLGGYRQCTGNQRATSISTSSFYLGGDSASDAQYSRWMAIGT